MEPNVRDPWLENAFLALLIASAAVWFVLAERRRHGPILAYRPRRPVPWNGIWIALPLLLVGVNVLAAFQPERPEIEVTVERLALGATQQLVLVSVFLTAALIASRADGSDFGVPTSARELVRDLRIGAITWLAAFAPVYCVQLVLYFSVSKSPGHPLVTSLMKNADTTLMIAAFIVAVIVAPLCEELIFRVLLQGWLEKWEDNELGWRKATAVPIAHVDASDETNDHPPNAVHELAPVENVPEFADNTPPRVGLGGLPYGWAPIALSSLLFALAHAGFGTDPIPLLVLSLGLGYVYQRTHSVVPSLTAHALFNGMSLLALWRTVSISAP